MADISIKGFEILEKLGEGGLGAVYKARQVSLDRLVAIKTLPPHFADDPISVEQFQMEAKIAATLKHPNIVQIHEAGQQDGLYYFVMEYVSGYTISSWLQRKGTLPERDALLIAGYVAEALEYAWDKARIVHGDLKPDNIMVDGDGTIKLADFLALTRPGGAPGPASGGDKVIGTPNFMSPEQVMGDQKELDYRTDMYALGAVLYQLMTSVLPFGDTPDGEQVMERQVDDTIPDPQDFNPDISDGMAWLIERLMVKDPNHRPVDWAQVRTDIARVMAGKLPLDPLPAAGASSVQRRPERMVPASPTSGAAPLRDLGAPGEPQAGGSADDSVSFGERILYAAVLAVVVAALVWLFKTADLFGGKPPGGEAPAVSSVEESVEAIPESAPARPAAADVAQTELPESAPAPQGRIEEEDAVQEFVSPPGAAGAVLSPEQEAMAEQRSADDLSEYLELMEAVMSCSQRHEYNKAVVIIERWRVAHRGHTYALAADAELERMEMAADMPKVLERGAEALSGKVVRARPKLVGKVEDVQDGMITLVRETTGGGARFQVDIYSLYERDLAELLRLADRQNSLIHLAILRVTEGRLTEVEPVLARAEAEGRDTEFVSKWLQDWRYALENIRADRAVEQAAERVAATDFVQAGAVLEAARKLYAQTDVFSWACKPRIDELHKAIVAAAQTAALAPAAGPAGESPAEVEDEDGENANGNGADDEQVEQLSIAELSEKLISYDGKLIKLRFTARGDIRQLNDELYESQLGHQGVFLPVQFPADGYKYVRSMPRWVGQKRKSVYGVVDVANRRVKLIGRTKTTPLGKQAIEYSW